MKSLVIHVLTSLDFGGVEHRMEVLAGALGHSKMRHKFVAIGKGGAAETRLRELGFEVCCLGLPAKIPSPVALTSLVRFFLREKPVVVHAHGAEADFHGLIAAWIARVPVRIGEEIGIPAHSRKAKAIFRTTYGTAHKVIGVSQVVAEWLVSSGEVPRSKAVRIDNPVQPPEQSERSVDKPERFRIGFVGRLEPVKNPVGLLDAFVELAQSGMDAELWFIGDGSQREVLKQRIAQNGLEERVTLWGYQRNPPDFIRKCHVFLQPSLSEGFSNALVEAMGCEVPVIGTAVGSAPEIVVQEVTGWLIPNPSHDLLVQAIRDAWQLGTAHLAQMGIEARKSVEGRYSPKQYVERLEKLYNDLRE